MRAVGACHQHKISQQMQTKNGDLTTKWQLLFPGGILAFLAIAKSAETNFLKALALLEIIARVSHSSPFWGEQS